MALPGSSIHAINFLGTPGHGHGALLEEACPVPQPHPVRITLDPSLMDPPLPSLIVPRVCRVWLLDKSKQLCGKSQGQTNFQGRASLCKFITFSAINKVTHSTFHLDEKFKISEGTIARPAEKS